jgi:hypothetical protein
MGAAGHPPPGAWHFLGQGPQQRLRAQLGKEPTFGQFAIMLRLHQDSYCRRLLRGISKELIKVGFPIRHGDDLRGLLHGSGARR